MRSHSVWLFPVGPIEKRYSRADTPHLCDRNGTHRQLSHPILQSRCASHSSSHHLLKKHRIQGALLVQEMMETSSGKQQVTVKRHEKDENPTLRPVNTRHDSPKTASETAGCLRSHCFLGGHACKEEQPESLQTEKWIWKQSSLRQLTRKGHEPCGLWQGWRRLAHLLLACETSPHPGMTHSWAGLPNAKRRAPTCPEKPIEAPNRRPARAAPFPCPSAFARQTTPPTCTQPFVTHPRMPPHMISRTLVRVNDITVGLTTCPASLPTAPTVAWSSPRDSILLYLT